VERKLNALIDAVLKIKTISILLVGPTGTGKSCFINTCFGRFASRESQNMTSCTSNISVFEGNWFGDPSLGRLTAIDTPGFLNTDGRDSHYLEELVDFFKMFPKNLLQLVLVTLPLTEMKIKSIYSDMIEQIGMLLGERAFDNTIFVTTLENQLNPDMKDEIQRRKDEWRAWLRETCFIESPKICNFLYGQPRSLSFIRDEFLASTPFTPVTSTKIDDLLRTNPCASVAEVIEKVQNFSYVKEKIERKLNDEKAALVEAERILTETEELSRRQKQQLLHIQQEIAHLEAKLIQYAHRPSSGGRK